MALYISTAFFACNNKGWSESWVHDAGTGTNLKNIADFDTFDIGGIWRKRQIFLGKQVVLTDTRTSFLDVNQDAWPLTPNMVGNGNFDAAYPTLALLSRFSNLAGSKWKNVYFRGISDNVEQKGGLAQLVDPVNADFVAGYNQFCAFLISAGWGFLSYRATDALKFTALGYGISSTDATFIDVTVPAGTFPLNTIKTNQLVNFKNVNKPAKSKLNGRHVVYVTGDVDGQGNQIVRVTRPMALFEWNGNDFIIQRFTRTFVPVEMSEPRKIASRDVGKTFGAPAGRHRVYAQG